jgi:hypothetical protein
MNRAEVLHWLEEHPVQVHGVPDELVDRCERAVRQHAAEDAWRAARAYVEGRMHEWEHVFGGLSSEAYLAKQVTAQLADELKRHEPGVEDGAEVHLAGAEILGALEPEARARVIEWVCELAREVEHQVWAEIVRFTAGEGRALARSHQVSDDTSFEASRNYREKITHIAQLVLRDYVERGPGAGDG